ncbi:MAG: S9 family peptidase [Planctomycetota bacterium]
MMNKRISTLVVISTFLAAVTFAQDATPPKPAPRQPAGTLTPHRVATIKAVTSASVSPDGAFVAYTLAVPRVPGKDEDGASFSELWLLNTQTNESIPYITGEVQIGSVAWSADGSGIYYLSKRNKEKAKSIYRIRARGGESRCVLSFKTDIQSFSVAPDDHRVTFVANEPEPERKEKERGKGYKQEVYEEDVKFGKVWIGNLASAADAPKLLKVEGHAQAVRWSPAEDKIAVAVSPTPLVDDVMMQSRVRVINLLGEPILKLDNPGKLGTFEWRPDGKTLTVIAATDINDPHAGYISTLDAERGGAWPKLAENFYPTHDFSGFAFDRKNATWQLTDNGTETNIGVYTGSYEAVPRVPTDGLAITSIHISKDSNVGAMVAQSPSHPPELYLWTPGESAAPRRVTVSNTDLDTLQFAKQEVIKYKARDGIELEGILIHPLNAEATKKYPLIVVVHGGPEAHNRNGWLTNYSNPGQMAAARGYAVFYPNYRGSTGRGVAFSKLGQGDPAGKEFDDLVDGVDHLVNMGLVDKSKVGVTGGSYGGYATAWCATKFSDRFAAGVMFVGISNKVSKVGTTDIANEEFYVHARHRVWDDWDLFLKRSPIYYADQCKTPLLIMGGKDDPRVDPGQSREMYRHLKLRSKAPVRLVQYPGEQHGNQKAAARLDYCLRMLEWFDYYLRGIDQKEGGMPAFELSYDDPDAIPQKK